MDVLTALIVVTALIGLATILGLVIRARSARVARGCGGDEHDLAVDGADVTLIQLSSPVCSACVAMRQVSESIVANDPTIAYREIDVVDAPEVATRHSVYSTPTTLILDSEGHVRARLIGAVRRADALSAITAARVDRVRA